MTARNRNVDRHVSHETASRFLSVCKEERE